GAFSMGNFYYLLYSYGHQLDPRAPMTIEPFTPVIIGSQKIANFVQTSPPQTGGLRLALSPLLVGAAMWAPRREAPRRPTSASPCGPSAPPARRPPGGGTCRRGWTRPRRGRP